MSGRVVLISGSIGSHLAQPPLAQGVLDDAGPRCAPVDPGRRRGVSEVRGDGA